MTAEDIARLQKELIDANLKLTLKDSIINKQKLD